MTRRSPTSTPSRWQEYPWTSFTDKPPPAISSPPGLGWRGWSCVASGGPNPVVAASLFASNLSGLLNATVCRGVQLSAILIPYLGTAFVGYQIDKQTYARPTAFPIGIPETKLHLGLSYQLDQDEAGYLRVASSFVGLFLDPDMNKELLHSDYERDKADGYPEAHLQIDAASPHWTELLTSCKSPSDQKRLLSHLHLPVGGRRFRPTLEDILEFVLCERLVQGRPGWLEAINTSREGFAVKQLRAAIRRHPVVALQALRDFGHL